MKIEDQEYTSGRKHSISRKIEFVSAIYSIKVRNENYDKDLDKWLWSNQRKFGHSYSFTLV